MTTTIPYKAETYKTDRDDTLQSYVETIRKNLIEGFGATGAINKETFSTVEVWAINALKSKIKSMLRIGGEDVWLKTPGIIIAGGCFTSMLQNEVSKDIDIFILDDEHAKYLAKSIIRPTGKNVTLHAVGDPFKNMNEKEKKEYIDAINHRHKNNANIEDVVNVELYGHKCQFIFTKYKTREELIDHFDFVHTKVSYDISKDSLYISKETFDAILLKKLLIANPVRGVAQWRLERFRSRGWNMWSIPDDLTTGIV